MEVPAVGGTTTNRVGASRDDVERYDYGGLLVRVQYVAGPMRMLRYGTSRIPISPVVVGCQQSLVLKDSVCSRRFRGVRPPTMLTTREVDGGTDE